MMGWAVEMALDLGYLLFHKNNMGKFSFRICWEIIGVLIITELSGRNTFEPVAMPTHQSSRFPSAWRSLVIANMLALKIKIPLPTTQTIIIAAVIGAYVYVCKKVHEVKSKSSNIASIRLRQIR